MPPSAASDDKRDVQLRYAVLSSQGRLSDFARGVSTSDRDNICISQFRRTMRHTPHLLRRPHRSAFPEIGATTAVAIIDVVRQASEFQIVRIDVHRGVVTMPHDHSIGNRANKQLVGHTMSEVIPVVVPECAVSVLVKRPGPCPNLSCWRRLARHEKGESLCNGEAVWPAGALADRLSQRASSVWIAELPIPLQVPVAEPKTFCPIGTFSYGTLPIRRDYIQVLPTPRGSLLSAPLHAYAAVVVIAAGSGPISIEFVRRFHGSATSAAEGVHLADSTVPHRRRG